jgi:hypothetical protein
VSIQLPLFSQHPQGQPSYHAWTTRVLVHKQTNEIYTFNHDDRRDACAFV